jgi:predicted rRNA methylase YqxC with S4 and FtsJ domains
VIPVGEPRDEILRDLEEWFEQNGFQVQAAQDSAVAGAEGNVERFYSLVFTNQS